jgi:hypothetical protein
MRFPNHPHAAGPLRQSSLLTALAALLLCAPLQMPAQSIPPQSLTPRQWIAAGAAAELPIILNDLPYMRYHLLTQNDKGTDLRDQIESRNGTVGRLIARNGRPLTTAEDDAERARLQRLIDHPSDFYHHHRNDQQSKDRAAALVRQMPAAMFFSFAPDQSPVPSDPHPQVVIDYRPDPAYSPPDIASQALRGITGRIWIDTTTARIVRMHADISGDLNFGWGILAHISRGGSLDLDQVDAGPRWIYSRLDEHITMRALIFKSIRINILMATGAYSTIPPMSFQDAARALLNTPLPAHCPCY